MTRTRHLIQLNSSFVLLVFAIGGFMAPDDRAVACASTVAGSILTEKLPDLLSHTNGASARAYLLGAFPSVVEAPLWLYEKISGCAGSLPPIASLGTFSQLIGSVWAKYFSLALTAGPAAELAIQTFKYWDASYTTTVCKQAGERVSCDESFQGQWHGQLTSTVNGGSGPVIIEESVAWFVTDDGGNLTVDHIYSSGVVNTYTGTRTGNSFQLETHFGSDYQTTDIHLNGTFSGTHLTASGTVSHSVDGSYTVSYDLTRIE